MRQATNPPLNHAEILLDFAICEYSGHLVWARGGRGYAGRYSIAGYITRQGYRRVEYRGSLILAHRLAWFYYHGKWPAAGLDHRDRNPLNNRIENLRECTSAENAQNRNMPSNNTSGYKGVTWRPDRQKWRAQRGIGNKRITLGHFDTPEEANAAYVAAGGQN